MSDRTTHRRQAHKQRRQEMRLTMREAREQQRDNPMGGVDLSPWTGRRRTT